jgi:hypothetical protein
MKRLWTEVKAHRKASTFFLVYWLAVWAFTALTFDRGMPPPAVVLQASLPLIAGALAGWFIGPTSDQKTRLLTALSGGAVVLINIAVIFAADGIEAVVAGKLELSSIAEWLWWCFVFGLFGAVMGMLGGFGGRRLAKAA